MSVETTAWAKQQTCGCPCSKAVLLELANWSRADGICEFRRVGDIALVIEVSERTVQRALRHLETPRGEGGLGLIRRIARSRRDGGQQANCFELVGYLYPGDILSPPLPDSECGCDIQTPPGDTVSPPGCQTDGGGGDRDVTPYRELESNLIDSPQSPPRRKTQRSPIAADWSVPEIAALPQTARDLAVQWPRGAYQAEAEAFHQHWLGRGERRANWDALWFARIPLLHPSVMRAGQAGIAFAFKSPPPSDTPPINLSPVRARAAETPLSERMRTTLQAAVPESAWANYLSHAAYRFEGQVLRVTVRSDFMRNWFETNFAAAILAAAQRIAPATTRLRIEAEAHWPCPSGEAAKATPPASPHVHM